MAITPVADPKIFQKREGAEDNIYQPRRHSSQMHTTNYMPFTQKKAGFLNKF